MTARGRAVGRLPWVWGEPVAARVPNGMRAADAPDTRVATRSVTTVADADALFLWVCQLRRAPYSYDWIDNAGRRSPRHADRSLLGLELGQSFMTIFTLTAFTQGRSVTLQMNPGWPTRVFGAITLMYEIERLDDRDARLSVLMWMPPIGRRLARARRYVLAWGDLLMMRKQLLVITALAEGDQ